MEKLLTHSTAVLERGRRMANNEWFEITAAKYVEPMIGTTCLVCDECVDVFNHKDVQKICDKCRAAILAMRKQMECDTDG